MKKLSLVQSILLLNQFKENLDDNHFGLSKLKKELLKTQFFNIKTTLMHSKIISNIEIAERLDDLKESYKFLKEK